MVDDLLSPSQVRKRGIFRPAAVRTLRRGASQRAPRLVDADLAIPDAGAVDANIPRRRGAQIRVGVTTSQTGGDRMKQVLQHARTGEIAVEEVPAPQLLPGCVLVRIAASLVSAGTERASAEFARKNLLQKAKSRPDLVRDVISKVQRDGCICRDPDGAQPSRSTANPWLQQRWNGRRSR